MRRLLLLWFFTCTFYVHAQRSDFDAIHFGKADTIAHRYQGEELYNLPVLALRLTAQLHTDVERFRAIYYWVCHNIRGNYDLTSTNEHMRRKLKNRPEELRLWNNQYKQEVFATLRNNKETLCTGYAYLIKELANLAGLQCVIIHGYGRSNNIKFDKETSPNHSWNAVRLDGKWYLCDATWSSGTINMATYAFTPNFDESFFLQDPAEFAESHKPLNPQWNLLLQESTPLSEVQKN